MQNQNPPRPGIDTPMVWQASDAQVQQIQTSVQVHLFTNLDWQTEEEPLPNQLCHLLTHMQQTLIGHYPEGHTLGEHYIAWAPLDASHPYSSPTFH